MADRGKGNHLLSWVYSLESNLTLPEKSAHMRLESMSSFGRFHVHSFVPSSAITPGTSKRLCPAGAVLMSQNAMMDWL